MLEAQSCIVEAQLHEQSDCRPGIPVDQAKKAEKLFETMEARL